MYTQKKCNLPKQALIIFNWNVIITAQKAMCVKIGNCYPALPGQVRGILREKGKRISTLIVEWPWESVSHRLTRQLWKKELQFEEQQTLNTLNNKSVHGNMKARILIRIVISTRGSFVRAQLGAQHITLSAHSSCESLLHPHHPRAHTEVLAIIPRAPCPLHWRHFSSFEQSESLCPRLPISHPERKAGEPAQLPSFSNDNGLE